jgi:glucan phosphoethanolaminetransferase (alkaline phosphatase superfamily)
MTYLTAVLLVILCFAVPAVISYLVSRRMATEARRRYHEVGIAVFLQLGVVFAVLLAFVFNNVWEQFNTADDAVDKESVDLQSAANRAAYLPEEWGLAIRHSLASYLESEINEEWPAMERREVSPATTVAYNQLFETVAAIPPSDPLIASTRESMLLLVSDVRDQRQLRLFQLKTNVPSFLWGLLIAFSSVLTAFIILSGVGHSLVQSLLVGVFSAFLVAIMLTIHMLDFPFEGSIRVSPEPLRAAQVHLDDIPLVYETERRNPPRG